MDTQRFAEGRALESPTNPSASEIQTSRNIFERISSTFLGRYGLSLGLFAILLAISAVLSYLGATINLTILILLGLAITSWYGGLGPGVLLAVLIVAASAGRQSKPEGVSMPMYAFTHFSNFALIVFIVALIYSRK